MLSRKVLFHLHKLGGGGAERQLAYLAQGLTKRNWRVHIVTLYEGGEYWDSLNKLEGCTLVSLGRKGKMDFSIIQKLVRYINAHNIEVVQGWMPPCNTFSSIAAKLSGRPSIMGIRASDIDYPLGGRLYVKSDKILAKLVSKKVIYNSYCGKEYHLNTGYPEQKSIVIPNGLLFSANLRSSEPLVASPCKLSMIARFDPMKGHEYIFGALKNLTDQGYPLQLHLYGDGSSARKKELQLLAKQMEIESIIIWHGFINDIWKALEDTDILVSASIYGEGQSNTLLEGMAAQRPMVATNVGDAEWLLGADGERGMVVPKKDQDALVLAIKTLIDHPIRALGMARRARRHVFENYSVDTMVEAYEALYLRYMEKG